FFFSKKIDWHNEKASVKNAVTILSLGFMVFSVNLTLAEIDRPQLLSRTFDRNYLVKYLGAYNYTMYDGVQTAQNSKQRAFASSNDLTNVVNFKNSHYAEPNSVYFGKAKGKNIIKIHLESF
ncbi:glycerol phosphate lipoteichoic acid synthase, partial [Priestia megaterium]